jgi:hypothetical protein
MQWVVYDPLADTIPRQEFGHFVVGAVSRHRTSGFDTFPRLPRKRHRFSNIFGRYSVFFFIFDRGRGILPHEKPADTALYSVSTSATR